MGFVPTKKYNLIKLIKLYTFVSATPIYHHNCIYLKPVLDRVPAYTKENCVRNQRTAIQTFYLIIYSLICNSGIGNLIARLPTTTHTERERKTQRERRMYVNSILSFLFFCVNAEHRFEQTKQERDKGGSGSIVTLVSN